MLGITSSHHRMLPQVGPDQGSPSPRPQVRRDSFIEMIKKIAAKEEAAVIRIGTTSEPDYWTKTTSQSTPVRTTSTTPRDSRTTELAVALDGEKSIVSSEKMSAL